MTYINKDVPAVDLKVWDIIGIDLEPTDENVEGRRVIEVIIFLKNNSVGVCLKDGSYLEYDAHYLVPTWIKEEA